MSFSITNNSANAVVTKIETLSSAYGSFTVTSGSFPLLSGDTISGTNTEINNQKGSPEGSILLFLLNGNAQIEYYLNGVLISANDYSSGLIEIKGPIIQIGDTISINVDEAVLPVPSPTPSSTPAPPSPSPTVTPTVTPTPSSTPAAFDPNSFGAIWWLDYSNPANVTEVGGKIYQMTNSAGGPLFQNTNSSNGPVYSSTGYLGISGSSIPNADGLASLSGDYGTTSAFTHFVFFSAITNTSGWEVAISDNNTSDYSGNTQGYRWFATDGMGGPSQIRTYNFYGDGSSVAPEPYITLSANTLYQFAIRVYQNGANAVTEAWVNGSIVDSTTMAGRTLVNAVDPIFNVCGNAGAGNVIFMEQFFFDKKLTDTQMGDMFTYLTNKY